MANKYIKNNGNGNFKVTVPFEINTYESWSVITQIVTPETFEDCTIVNNLNSDDEEIKSFKLGLNSAGHLILSLSTDGTSYSSTLISAYRLEENNQLYYIRISWSGTAYTVEVSTNNTDWTLYIYHESSQVLYSNVLYVNFIPTIDLKYFKGKLDINSTELIKKTSSDADNVTIFSGSESTGTGYLNHGAYINNNIASSFNTDKYIICNGAELKNYVKIITRININNFVTNERQAIISNINRQGIFCKDGKLGLALSTDGNEILSTNSIIEVNKNYYIGYIFLLDNGIYKHKLYYMEDDGYYSDYTELPDFDAYCMKPWTKINTISNDNNIFKNTIYIGSNKVKYLSTGSTIDLNNTIISNNVVTYSISKPGLSSIEDQSEPCYVPVLGTRILNSSDTVIDNINLVPMYKVTISAVEIDSNTNIDLSYATVTYTVTNSNYGTNGTTYYKKTTSTDQGSSRVIYVLPGSNLTYRVTNLNGYHSYEHTITNIDSDTVQQEQFSNFKGLKFTAQQDDTDIYINKTGTPIGEDLQYSYNGIDWYELPIYNSVPIGNIGEPIYIKGNNPNGLNKDSDNYISFQFTGKVNASGNVNSLLDNADGYSLNNNELPSNNCYYGLFYNSSNLVTPPELPATKLTVGCYSYMFNGCASLTVAPELPATNLDTSCYSNMFAYCTSLIRAPELPATTLANGCYAGMFSHCTNMEITPTELPATELKQTCYESMFAYCTKITQSPIIYGKTVQTFSLSAMFWHCQSLNTIKLSYTGYFNSSFSLWVSDVSATGNIYYNGNDTTIGDSAIPTGWTVICEKLKFTAKENNSSVGYTVTGTPIGTDLKYSYDGVNWIQWNGNNILLNNNEYIYVKGNNPNGLNSDSDNYINFTMTGKIEASGNINSLLDNNDGNSIDTIPNTWCYNRLFSRCTSLTKAPDLPIINLKDYCYAAMFYNCASLTQAPELHATNLKAYCYSAMFQTCTSLVNAPQLPATTLTDSCYQYMFNYCTSLVQAPELPATTLTDYCYQYMFSGCNSLNYIKINYTGNFNNNYFTAWVHNVPRTGNFYYNGTDINNFGVGAIPTGWTVHTF